MASYEYTEDANRYLSMLDYGNDGSVEYTYDNKGRLLTQTYEDNDTVTYSYDNNGALATMVDHATGITTTYYYDLSDRMAKYVESGTGYSHGVEYTYDEKNNLTKLEENINGVDHITEYDYDDDNRIETVTANGTTITYTYDDFGRLEEKVTAKGEGTLRTESYTYVAPENGKTSAQVATHTIVTGNTTQTFTYTYDGNGNITSIFDGSDTTTYAYDSANQLIRENNQAGNYTYTWTYDNAGNILDQKIYSYTTGELSTPQFNFNYTYGSSDWGDILTRYNGAIYKYDAIGNLVKQGALTYTWEHGRQLASISYGSDSCNFSYNSDGMRTQRTDGTTTYKYIYNGSSLSQMTVGSNTLSFAYDADGRPMTVTYNGTTYYYATNLQGDVTGIFNEDGTYVVKYTYDAWGIAMSITGSMASTLGRQNPLRYRGYVYDQETGLYYLQSRYYNPRIGRFINADAFAATGQGFVGNNMFAYCGNNPVLFLDKYGTRPILSISLASENEYEKAVSFAYMNKQISVVDLTDDLNAFMQHNAKKLTEYVQTNGAIKGALYFYDNVNDGGALDIKLQDSWKFEDTKKYFFNGQQLRYDDPGNINFGYVGAVLFPVEILCLGAGVNQISKWGFKYGNFSTYYDDPRDNEMIKWGFNLYEGG